MNADPTNPAMDRPHFLYVPPTEKIAKVEKEDVEFASMFLPAGSSVFIALFTDPRGCTDCTCSPAFSFSPISGCRSGRIFTNETPSTWPTGLKWPGCSGTLLIWFGSLFPLFYLL